MSAWLTVGCDGRGDGNHIKAATNALAKGELEAAKISLKQALLESPDSGEARYLMGKLLLSEGSSDAAVVEFSKARQLKYAPDQVNPLLARAMLAGGGQKKVIDEFATTPSSTPDGTAELAAQLASAYTVQGDYANAEAVLLKALVVAPTNASALLARARLLAGAGKVDEALGVVAAVLKPAPSLSEAWSLQGDLLLYGKRDLPGAVEAYTKAVNNEKMSLRPRVALISTLLLSHQVPEAAKEFDAFRKVYPAHPQTVYFAAQFAAYKGDFKAAREIFAQLVLASPENPMLLTLAGTNEMELGSFVQAETYLGKAIKLAPDMAQPRRLLAQTYLRIGRPAKVIDVLRPVLARQGVDVETIYLAAIANLQLGDLAQADTLLARALGAGPEDVRVKSALAIRQLSKGDEQGGLASLQAAATADKGDVADMALIAVRMRRREFDAALQAVDALDAKHPNLALVADLRAQILLAKKDSGGARAQLEHALTLQPAYFPAASRLAALDIADGKINLAHLRFDAILKADPANIDAMMALAEIAANTGASVQDVSEAYNRVRKAAPSDRAPRLALIEYLLSKRLASQALVVAQDAVAALPNDTAIIEALGRVQMASGQVQQAITSFSKLASLKIDAAEPLLQLATAYIALGDTGSALPHIRRALDLAPTNISAQQALIRLSLKSGKADMALKVARRMQATGPKSPVGYALEGDILRQQKNPGAARAAYEAGIAKSSDTGYLATKVHSLLLAEGKSADAARYADDWINRHPADAIVMFHLGMVALQVKDYATADRRFRQLLEIQPDNARARNNLAWAAAEIKKPDALKQIDMALKLAPFSPDYHDTRAHVLDLAGEPGKALDSAKQAADLAPDQTRFWFALARLQLKLGQKAEARQGLERLAKDAGMAADRAEAGRLLSGL